MSVAAFSSSVLRHGARSIRQGGLPFFFATLMTGLGAFSIGAYATLTVNFERISSSVGQSVAAVAFLDPKTIDSANDAEEIRAKLALDPRVASATLVTPEEGAWS